MSSEQLLLIPLLDVEPRPAGPKRSPVVRLTPRKQSINADQEQESPPSSDAGGGADDAIIEDSVRIDDFSSLEDAAAPSSTPRALRLLPSAPSGGIGGGGARVPYFPPLRPIGSGCQRGVGAEELPSVPYIPAMLVRPSPKRFSRAIASIEAASAAPGALFSTPTKTPA